jgi:hypothetical protein
MPNPYEIIAIYERQGDPAPACAYRLNRRSGTIRQIFDAEWQRVPDQVITLLSRHDSNAELAAAVAGSQAEPLMFTRAQVRAACDWLRTSRNAKFITELTCNLYAAKTFFEYIGAVA